MCFFNFLVLAKIFSIYIALKERDKQLCLNSNISLGSIMHALYDEI